MAYKLIEGEVRLVYQTTRRVGSRPDGDSVWFKPDNPALLADINGRSANLNPGGLAQLRFEGIDALELHYPHSNHQSKLPTVAARDFLLDRIGFDLSEIEYAPNPDIPSYVRSTKPVKSRAHILTRAIDPFGRPVAFVFKDNAPERSGADIFMDVDKMDTSLNAHLIRAGHVYPAYYSSREVRGVRTGGLPGDLRDHLSLLSISARDNSLEVWNEDSSTDDSIITEEKDLYPLAIWPKLYRRLAKFYADQNANHDNLHGFVEWLHADRGARDDLMLIKPIAELLNFSDILTVNDTTISMDYAPEEIIIVPR